MVARVIVAPAAGVVAGAVGAGVVAVVAAGVVAGVVGAGVIAVVGAGVVVVVAAAGLGFALVFGPGVVAGVSPAAGVMLGDAAMQQTRRVISLRERKIGAGGHLRQ